MKLGLGDYGFSTAPQEIRGKGRLEDAGNLQIRYQSHVMNIMNAGNQATHAIRVQAVSRSDYTMFPRYGRLKP